MNIVGMTLSGSGSLECGAPSPIVAGRARDVSRDVSH
jgi:hypothetical protein